MCICNYEDREDFAKIISTLAKLPNTLIKLDVDGESLNLLRSFIAKFTKFQEFVMNFYYGSYEDEYFNYLQHITLPQLQILKFKYRCPKNEYLIKFLEIHGKNLKEIYLHNSNNSTNLALAKFCPNLKSLDTVFKNSEVETLKAILNNCQQLVLCVVRSI